MGFEPTVSLDTPVFKTGTLNRSVIHPNNEISYMLNPISKNITLFNHMYELKYRFLYYILSNIITMIVCYEFSNELIYILVKPLLQNEVHKIDQLIYTNITEAFFTYINISIFFAIYLTIPILIYQLFFYVLPGLYNHEKNKVILFIIVSKLTLILSIFTIYNIVLPIIWSFFLEFDNTNANEVFQLSFEGKVNEYIYVIQNLFLSFTFCSQIPVLILLLLKLEVLNIHLLIKSRTIIVICCFILGALLSPPDVFSQTLLAIPLYIMFEMSIFVSIYLKNSLKKTIL